MRDAKASRVQDPEVRLGLYMTLLRSLPPPLGRFYIVPLNAPTLEVHETEIVLCIEVAVLRAAAVGLFRLSESSLFLSSIPGKCNACQYVKSVCAVVGKSSNKQRCEH